MRPFVLFSQGGGSERQRKTDPRRREAVRQTSTNTKVLMPKHIIHWTRLGPKRERHKLSVRAQRKRLRGLVKAVCDKMNLPSATPLEIVVGILANNMKEAAALDHAFACSRQALSLQLNTGVET